MAMIYTLVTSAKEWLFERFGQDNSIEDAQAEEAAKEDVWLFVLHFYISCFSHHNLFSKFQIWMEFCIYNHFIHS